MPGAFRQQIEATLQFTELGIVVSNSSKEWLINEPKKTEIAVHPCKKKRLSGGSNIMPMIEEYLTSTAEYFQITTTSQYQYPGVAQSDCSSQAAKFIGYTADCSELPHHTAGNAHFLYTENQLSKGHYNDNERIVVVDGETRTLRICYAVSKGVLVCSEESCGFAASKNAKKCPRHPAQRLVPSGPCPVYIVYEYPQECDKSHKRWIGGLTKSLTVEQHRHT